MAEPSYILQTGSFAEVTLSRDAAVGECIGAKGEIAGVSFSRGTIADLESLICGWLRSRPFAPRLITYVNPHVFNLSRKHETLRRVLQTADVIAVDGIGFAVAVRWLTGRVQTRTVMTPLFDRVLSNQNVPPLRAILVGGRPAVAKRGAEAINCASLGLRVIATCDGYASEARHLEFLQAHADADAVLVAMGSPRSEAFMAMAREVSSAKVLWNIGGGTLHFYAGTLKRVPLWVSRLGLQWLWRIAHEPWIAPRYFIGIPQFIASLVRLRIAKLW